MSSTRLTQQTGSREWAAALRAATHRPHRHVRPLTGCGPKPQGKGSREWSTIFHVYKGPQPSCLSVSPMSPIAYERMCRPSRMRDARPVRPRWQPSRGRAEFVDRPGSGFPFAVGPRRAFGFRFAARGVTRFRLPQLTVTHMKHITRPNSVLQPINMSNYLRDRETLRRISCVGEAGGTIM